MMRASCDAVMIGRGTAEADDPMLDVRNLGALGNPVRIVLDRQLHLSPNTRLVTTSNDIPTWIVHDEGASNDALKTAGVKLLPATGLLQSMEALAKEGLTRIFWSKRNRSARPQRPGSSRTIPPDPYRGRGPRHHVFLAT